MLFLQPEKINIFLVIVTFHLYSCVNLPLEYAVDAVGEPYHEWYIPVACVCAFEEKQFFLTLAIKYLVFSEYDVRMMFRRVLLISR